MTWVLWLVLLALALYLAESLGLPPRLSQVAIGVVLLLILLALLGAFGR